MKLKIYLKLIITAIVLMPCVGFAQLSGAYSIDSATVTGGTNYQTFTEAVTALTTSGVSGPVTFSVLQGTYSEQISIPSITGTSIINRITFKGLGDITTIVATPSTSNYPVVGFNAASHIVLDSIKIEVLGSQGWGVHFMNQSDSIAINNCHIIVPSLSTCYGILASSSISATSVTSTNIEALSVTSNEIEGGSSGIYIKGLTPKTSYGSGFIIDGNTVVDFTGNGIVLSNNNNVYITNNEVSSSQTTANVAVSCWDAGDDLNITGNKLYLSSNAANTRVLALSMAPGSGAAGSSTSPVTVANNFIQYEGSNSTSPTGILLKNKSYLKIYNNTIKVKNQGTTSNCIWLDANNTRALAGIEIRNNILVLENFGAGSFFYSSANGASFDAMVIDHNNYYAPSSYFSIKLPNGVNSTINTYASLAIYKANAYGYGTGALNVDPEFVSATDLHATSIIMNDSGAVIASITTDIDGDIRNTTTPDIGADEYTIVPTCYGPAQTFVECDGFTVTVGSNIYSTTGVYYDTLVGVGCDSIVVTDLTVNPVPTYSQILVECVGYSVTVGTNTYTTTGVYTDTLVGMSSLGCDSIVITDLTVGNYKTTNQAFSECDGFTVTVNGNIYSTTGVYNDTLTGMATGGCDSVVVTDLTILSPTSSTDTIIACDTYMWMDGVTYTSANTTAKDTLVNAVGCDSVVTLNLTINSSSTSTDTQVACDSYTWINGSTYTSSNTTATHTLINAVGCDSVVTLNLTIKNSTTSIDAHSACTSYTWINGVTYTSSTNTAKDTLVNAVGCDSIVTLHLTINPTYTTTDVQTVCDSLTWVDGVTYYSNNNTATFMTQSVHGCDSTATLDLTIINSTVFTDVIQACGAYTWIDGVTYTTSNNTASDTLVSSNGCDSIVMLDLTVGQANSGSDVIATCDSLIWIDGITYYSNTSNVYYTVTNASGCDSVVRLFLTIIPVDVSTTNNWAVITANATGMTYQWMDCSDNSVITGETRRSYAPGQNGSYKVAISDGSCADTSDCVTLTHVGIDEGSRSSLASLYPNPSNGNVSLTMLSNTGMVQINVLDISGKLQMEVYSDKKSVDLDLSDLKSGVYFVRLIANNQQQIIRLVKL